MHREHLRPDLHAGSGVDGRAHDLQRPFEGGLGRGFGAVLVRWRRFELRLLGRNLDAPCRHPIGMRRRGFTLVELGVVLCAATILTAVVSVGLRGVRRAAQTRRAGEEVARLLGAARNAVFSQSSFNLGGCTSATECTTSTPNKLFLGAPIPANGLCYDFASSGWGGAAPPPAALTAAIFGPAGISNQGRNAFGSPIALCVLARRVSILTCSSPQDIPVEIAGGAPDTCALPGWSFAGCPVATDQCFSVSAVFVPPFVSRLAASYKYLYWGEATVGP
jgi:type II secretory pathway pseudopilin PulG